MLKLTKERLIFFNKPSQEGEENENWNKAITLENATVTSTTYLINAMNN